MIRFLLTALMVYLGFRFFKGFFQKGTSKDTVKGNPKSKPLDLRDADVEDAHFEDIKDKES